MANERELEGLGMSLLSPYSAEIMESGIFYKGGLKGKKLEVSGPPQYQIFSISNFDKLVENLSMKVMTFEEVAAIQAEKKIIENKFEKVKQDFLKLEENLKLHLGSGAATKIEKMRGEIMSWKHDILKKIVSTPISPLGFELAAQLASFVPDAPDLIIAKRTNDLLEALGKEPISSRTLKSKISKLRKRPEKKV